MTWFEELSSRLNVLEQDEKGLYTGKCIALYYISLDVTLSDDEEIFKLSDEEKEKIIVERFYKKFPYLKRAEG